jgi:hypothetical protein
MKKVVGVFFVLASSKQCAGCLCEEVSESSKGHWYLLGNGAVLQSYFLFFYVSESFRTVIVRGLGMILFKILVIKR